MSAFPKPCTHSHSFNNFEPIKEVVVFEGQETQVFAPSPGLYDFIGHNSHVSDPVEEYVPGGQKYRFLPQFQGYMTLLGIIRM